MMSAAGEKKPSVIESVLSHAVIVTLVAFSLYPVAWVISTAFSAGSAPERRILPVPGHFTFAHVVEFVTSPHVLSQAGSSLVVSVATALVRLPNRLLNTTL